MEYRCLIKVKIFFSILFVVLSVPVSSLASVPIPETPEQVVSEQTIPSPEYAKDRIIVKYKPGKSPQELKEKARMRASERATLLGKMKQRIADTHTKLRGDKNPEEELILLDQHLGQKKRSYQSLANFGEGEIQVVKTPSQSPTEVSKVLAEFDALDAVSEAYRDTVYTAFQHTPNDPYYNYQWHYGNIHLPEAWDIAKGDSDNDAVIVAVLDTGIYDAHQDLAGKILAKYDCTGGGACVADSGADGNGHGTHVAGTIGAATNNSKNLAGAGYNVKMVTFKVLDDEGSGYMSWGVAAFDELTQTYPGKHIVVNMSLGAYEIDPLLQDAITAATNDGMLVIAAAGNDNVSTPSYPASFDEVLSVGATTNLNVRATYSNYGTHVDVVAPGGSCTGMNVTTCIASLGTNPTSMTWMQGTSMATPHVSGVVALMWALNPTLTNVEVRDMIQDTADPIEGTGSEWMYGKVDAYAAVLAAQETAPTPTPSPSSGPTATPTATPTPNPSHSPTPTPWTTATPTPTPNPNPVSVNLIIKTRFPGSIPNTDVGKTISAQATLFHATQEAQIKTLTFTRQDNQNVWSATWELSNLFLSGGYQLQIKGPKHLSRKACHATPEESTPGAYRCQDRYIKLEEGDNIIDLTGLGILAGDIVPQDGVIDARDIVYVRNNFGNNEAQTLVRADLNFDSVIDTQDYILIMNALGYRYDD